MDHSIFEKQKEDALSLLNHGLQNMQPAHLLRNQVSYVCGKLYVRGKEIELSGNARIWVFGSGKAAAGMAEAMEDILGDAIYDGIVICPYGSATDTEYIQQFEAAHPIPDENSEAATRELLALTEYIKEGDIVFYLMSGGSSSLLCLPHPDLELGDIQIVYKVLLNSGLNIHEVNTIRKQLSAVKGGLMLRNFRGATLLNFIISDVPGDDPVDIGSGPLIPQTATYQDAWRIIEKHDLAYKLPHSVHRFLMEGNQGLRSNPQSIIHPDHKIVVLGTAYDLAKQIGEAAEKMDYNVFVAHTSYDGEARQVSRKVAGTAISVLSRNDPISKPAVLVHFGESVVHVTGTGRGGRNQELALAASLAIEGQHYITILSAGTDGRDGETDAAGAICTSNTALLARSMGIEPESYLLNNDSYNFFSQLDSLIQLGATGNNLMDIQITIINK